MIRLRHPTAALLSGFIWLTIGCALLMLGLNFLVESLLKENLIRFSHPFLDALAPHVGGFDSAALFLIVLGLLIGRLKGRYVLSKTVQKGIHHLLTLSDPAPLSQIYTKKYLVLIAIMVGLGYLMRFASFDVRGTIDIAIGSALVHGAMLYFRQAYWIRKQRMLATKG